MSDHHDHHHDHIPHFGLLVSTNFVNRGEKFWKVSAKLASPSWPHIAFNHHHHHHQNHHHHHYHQQCPARYVLGKSRISRGQSDLTVPKILQGTFYKIDPKGSPENFQALWNLFRSSEKDPDLSVMIMRWRMWREKMVLTIAVVIWCQLLFEFHSVKG